MFNNMEEIEECFASMIVEFRKIKTSLRSLFVYHILFCLMMSFLSVIYFLL